jgi:hypothetical protein
MGKLKRSWGKLNCSWRKRDNNLGKLDINIGKPTETGDYWIAVEKKLNISKGNWGPAYSVQKTLHISAWGS